MSTITTNRPVSSTVTFSSVSSLDRACIALRRELQALGYNNVRTREICEHAFRERCLVGAGVDADDLDRLTTVFVDGFDQVPQNSKLWDRLPGRWITAGDIIVDVPKPAPDPARDSREWSELMGRYDIRARPTDEDWQEYNRWAEWREEAYVEPYRIEAECDEVRTTRR